LRKLVAGISGLTLTLSLAAAVGPAGAVPLTAGHPAVGPTAEPDLVSTHDLPNPLEDKRRAMRSAALEEVISGEANPIQKDGSTVVDLGASPHSHYGKNANAKHHHYFGGGARYVELEREQTDRIFVILAEFGDQRHPSYPDQDTDPDTAGPVRFDGPLHNQIPEPDRSVNNRTVWQPDYNRAHYEELYFGDSPRSNSVKKFYEKQSSGRYSVDGEVTDWVRVPYNEARYGRSNGFPCDATVCSNTWRLIQDAVTAWIADQHAAGRTDAQIQADLASFDQWDRYDYDGDGDFNEPDGYIDHFQIVHAGGDQADGDPIFGEDAIWSHRWYVQTTPIGGGGPDGFGPFGGTPIGDTGLWIGDYTIQPENGGVSVFAHEYGHDLGLPDHYDTAGGDNGVEWWNLMAQSRVSGRHDVGLGTRAADLSAWDKLQLGWLDYEVVNANQHKTLKLGPHEYNTKDPQGLIVVLPQKTVDLPLVDPYEGDHDWWSTSGNDLNTTLSRQVTLGAGTSTLTFQAQWDIEDCGADPCDYAFVEVDSGTGWTAIPGSITTAAEGNGIDGTSDGWQPATFDLSAYAGQTIGLRFRYSTDGAVGGMGFFADAISITSGGSEIFSDGAEAGDNGWTADGFQAVGASLSADYSHYYIASNRSHVSYDRYLATGPYNFGFQPELPDWVEHFSYGEGLLISYWDTSFEDNNTSEHEGHGLVLPIDSHPKPLYRNDGVAWRSRVQVYDAPFGLKTARPAFLHWNGDPSPVFGGFANPTFDDSKQYWYPEIPQTGVKVPTYGVKIRVLVQHGTTMVVKVS